MATQRIAQGLASLGRNGDSMLMHVSPDEVSSLQRMGKPHGISLTVNPQTGLPEAFSFGKFFKSIAPTLAGAALAPATGGASLGLTGMAATAAPIIGGMATGVALGQDPFTAALSGFGGGNLANGIAGMGAGSTANTANASNLSGNLSPSVAEGVQYVPNAGGEMVATVDPAITSETAKNLSTYGPMTSGNSNFMAGLGSIGQEGSWDAFKTGMGGASGPASDISAGLSVGMPLGMSYLAGSMPSAPGENEEDKYDPKRTLNLNTNTGLKLMAQGGMTSGGSTSTYGNPDGTRAQNTLNETYGLGRLNALAAANTTANAEMGGFARGGYLDGEGDGMSDSIPATIEGKQPARLADGEFVIPADVVSHLGNGSTKAGAQHLYAMLDKVRKARTGNKKQGKQINPNKYLPAK
jgi:hypothetical protein